LLNTLEKKGFVKSEWNMSSERPKKIYSLTSNGQNMLNFTEESLNLICRKLSTQPGQDQSTPPAVAILEKLPPHRQTI
jgi:DNA-binding PadR family transcriptional regulator